jgi:hypothetical protein
MQHAVAVVLWLCLHCDFAGSLTSINAFDAVPPQEHSWLTSLATQLLQIGCKLVPESWHTSSAAAASAPDEPDNPKLSSKTV